MEGGMMGSEIRTLRFHARTVAVAGDWGIEGEYGVTATVIAFRNFGICEGERDVMRIWITSSSACGAPEKEAVVSLQRELVMPKRPGATMQVMKRTTGANTREETN
ncbi:hypothetical protein CGLO_09522 [Colletotrichum gloeosporioides Cg-14]|uniref:Uncharacterized protein n=1 Tax=Colletotrichum gloeosporioides (strain Cg-14) TaxID=1237896 RepID=T0LHG0_COLGC|nr:hypothetical protein CGLO_09522 [Colletotrichum gloeosporioides Cg-14]